MKAHCSLFRKCSGCTLMQFPYVKQLRDKGQIAEETLGRFVASTPRDGAPSPIHPVVPSPKELAYRTSTKLCLHQDEFGRRVIGLYERGSKKVVGIPQCPVHDPKINQFVAKLQAGPSALTLPFYNHGKKSFQEGCLKFLTLRYCPDTQSMGVVVSHTGVNKALLHEWAQQVAKGPVRVSIYESLLLKRDHDLILSERTSHLAGPKELLFRMGQQEFALTPLAFFQANHSLTEAFIEEVRSVTARGLTAGQKGALLLDLYGGFGAYGLSLADDFQKVIVVDTNASAIATAKSTAQIRGFTHVDAVKAGVESFLDRQLSEAQRRQVSHVIVNPPRGGLSERVVKSLISSNFPNFTHLTYVSCNIETLKRDLQHLVKSGGFLLESAQPFDMFPHTDHLEMVTSLRRLKPRPAFGKPPKSRSLSSAKGRPSPKRTDKTKKKRHA